MAAVDEIAIKLGVKTGDLKAALLDAGAQIKKFKKDGESSEDEGFMGQLKGIKNSLRNFKDVLAAGGIATAVVGFFNLAIDSARKSKDATDANAEAVRGFADALDGIKEVAGKVAVTTVGTFNRLGEAIGETINIARSFIQHGSKGFDEWARVQDAIATSARDAAIAEANLAEARKKHGAEFESITKQLADIEKKREEQSLKGMTNLETQLNLQDKLYTLLEKQSSEGLTAIERRRVQLEIAQTQLALDETTLAVKKDQAAEAKKEAEDAERERKKTEAAQDKIYEKLTELNEKQEKMRRDGLTLSERQNEYLLEQAGLEAEIADLVEGTVEYNETYNRLLEVRGEIQKTEEEAGKNNVEIAKLLLKGEKNLTDIEKEKLKLLTGQTTEHDQQVELSRLLQTGVENLTEKEKARLLVLTGQTAEIKKQNEQVDLLKTKVETTGDVRELTDAQLEEARQKITQQRDRAIAGDALVGGVGTLIGTFKSSAQLQAQSALFQIENEQRLRREFAQLRATFGGDYVERKYAPDIYERLSQIFSPDLQKKTATSVDRIDRTLTNLFPKEAAGRFP